MPFSDMERAGDRPRYEDIDFEERAKQEHLDSLYDDDYDDYRGGRKSKLPLILGIVGLVLIVFLIFKTVTLSSQLEEAQQKVTDFEQLQQDNEQLKLNIVALEEKLTKNGISLTDDTTSGENGGENASADSGQYDTYTVVSGDTLSGISNKVYGNFSGYKKILEANGLTENSSIQIGQVLKIPKN